MGDFANYLADCLAELETDSEEERDFWEQMRDPLAVEDDAGGGGDHEGDGVPPEPERKPAAKAAPPLAKTNVPPTPALEDLTKMLAKKKKERGVKRKAAVLGQGTMLTPAQRDAQNRQAAKTRRAENARRKKVVRSTVKKIKKNKKALFEEKKRREAAAKKADRDERDKRRQEERARQQRERMALAMQDVFENPESDEEYDPYSFGFSDE